MPSSLPLSFDLEVWDAGISNTTTNPGEAGFKVVIDINKGDGFVPLLDLGQVTTGKTLQKPTTQGAYIDGNDPANRVTFDSGILPADIPVGSQLRVRWTADKAPSLGWLFGVDNVKLSTAAGPTSTLCGDLDLDRDLDSADLAALLEHWTGSQASRLAAVPEPSCPVLIVLGLAGLVIRRRTQTRPA